VQLKLDSVSDYLMGNLSPQIQPDSD